MDNRGDDSEERQVRNVLTFMNQTQKVGVTASNPKASQANNMNQFRFYQGAQ